MLYVGLYGHTLKVIKPLKVHTKYLLLKYVIIYQLNKYLYKRVFIYYLLIKAN